VVGDAHALPFRDNTFDRVFAFVFEHLRDPKKAAGEIWKGSWKTVKNCESQRRKKLPATEAK